MAKDYERVEDEIASGWAELQRARDYADPEKYSLERIDALGLFWLEEEDNPLRSPRGQREARVIVARLAFESAYRQGRVDELRKAYE